MYGIILVAVMLFRPEGLIPSRERAAELRGAEEEPQVSLQEQSLYNQATPP